MWEERLKKFLSHLPRFDKLERYWGEEYNDILWIKMTPKNAYHLVNMYLNKEEVVFWGIYGGELEIIIPSDKIVIDIIEGDKKNG